VSYMFQMPTAQVWKKLAEEGKLNEAQRHFWEPKPTEELYDLQTDPHEVQNLASSPAHNSVLEKLRAAHVAHMERTRDLGFIPEAERLRLAGDRSPRDVFASDSEYPFANVFALAQKASDLSFTDTLPFVLALGEANATLRYWAVLGLHIRKADGVKAGYNSLVKLLADPSPSVRIAAAEALATHGPPDDLAPSLDTLLAAADPVKNGNPTATAALTALDNLGAKAAAAKPKLSALPFKSNEGPTRLREYPTRLLKHLNGDAEKD
ncbi:MAG: HEAT repeat domain-containing protein, partial [Roseimicrobium sp.]